MSTEREKERWGSYWLPKYLKEGVPPKFQDWVLKEYQNPLITNLAQGLHYSPPKSQSVYLGMPNLLKGQLFGYAVILRYLEQAYPQVRLTPQAVDFTQWCAFLKSTWGSSEPQKSESLLRGRVEKAPLLLVHNLPLERGPAWEHKELLYIFNTRFQSGLCTVWVGPEEIHQWSSILREPSLESFVTMDCPSRYADPEKGAFSL